MNNVMKKLASILLAVSLFAASPALAATELVGRPVADGVVAATRFVDVTAPYSGTLASFDLKAGDTVAQGDTLLNYVTSDVYAPEDGVVKTVFVQPGDDAAAAMARYGALLGLEPSIGYQVNATTTGADKNNENKILHLGETLYFKTSGSNATEGVGRVTAVSGSAYSVDVISGDFDLNVDVTLYRRDNYASASAVGKGKVARRDPLLVSGTGRVAEVMVTDGARVVAGDLLLKLVGADAAPDAYQQAVTALADGVVAQVAVTPGQQVWKGALLCRISLTEALEVRAEVDEVDLGTLAVGDLVPITLDMAPGNVLMATVTHISQLGVSKQNAAYFTVTAQIPAGSGMLGASASMYLPMK